MKTKNLLKKAFLLLALVGGANSAWASTVDDLATISSDYTFIGQTTVGGALTSGALYDNNKIISLGGSGYATNKGNTTIDGNSYYNCHQVKSNRQIAFKVSGACTLTLYGESNSGRKWQVGSTSAGTEYGTSTESISEYSITSAGVVYINCDNQLYLAGFKVTFPSGDDPIITATPASVNIKATESGVEVTEDIAVTGANLDGSTLTATLSPAVTGLSVSLGSNTITDGAISTTATLHYTQTANASGSTTLTLSDGTTSKNVTVNYKSQVVATELAAVSSSEPTSLDLSKVGTGLETIAVEDGYVVLTDAGSEVSFADNLAVAAIAGVGVTWRSDAIQGPLFKFKTTVPGYVTVKFSDVGSSGTRANRYANVNGTRSDVYSTTSASGGVKTCSPIAVSAGEVIIKGQVQGDGDTYTDNQIRIFTISFTPTVSKTITDAGWATFCSDKALDLEHATGLTDAYIVTGASGNILNTTSVKGGTIPENTGILIEAPEGTVTIPVVASSSTDVSGNKLVGVTTETPGVAAGIYVLMGTPKVGFYETTKAFTVGANTAYLPANFTSLARSAFFFGGDITAVDNVEAAAEAKAKEGKFIENGKLVIVKNGVKYNAAGAQVK